MTRLGRVRAKARSVLRDLQGPQWERLRREGLVSCGEGTYGVEHIRIPEFRLADGTWVGSRLRIGKYCSVAPCEVFLGGNHHAEWVSQYPLASKLGLPGAIDDAWNRGDVVLGNDVWVGHDAMILSGVTVGDGAVIAARAVVTKDVRPYAVVAGNPAREVKRRFDDETVARVHALAWWDWPVEEIVARQAMLQAVPDASA